MWDMPFLNPGSCDIFPMRMTQEGTWGDFAYSRVSGEFGFVDLEPQFGQVSYRIEISDNNGNEYWRETSVMINEAFKSGILGVSPNPGRSSPSIKYYASVGQEHSIKIYDIRGRLITILVDGENGTGGEIVTWNLVDMQGNRVPSGCYFCLMENEHGIIDRRKILLLQ